MCALPVWQTGCVIGGEIPGGVVGCGVSGVRVRPATAADRERVCAVHTAAIEREGPRAYTDGQVAAWNGDRSPSDYEVDLPDVPFLVAEIGGRVVGFGELRPDGGEYFERVPEAYGEVRAVYVNPDASRQGIGTRLVRALESRARSRSLSGLGLHASKNAVGFYRACGYERLGTRDHEFGDNGVTGVVVEMAREL